MAIALELPGSIKSLNPVPVDWSYGPFATVAAAKAAIPLGLRYDGLTVQITGSGNYWWKQTDLTDPGLVVKSGGVTNSAGNTELPMSQGIGTNLIGSSIFSSAPGNLDLGTGLGGTIRNVNATGSGANIDLQFNSKGLGVLTLVGNAVILGASTYGIAIGDITIQGNQSSVANTQGGSVRIYSGQGNNGNASSGNIFVDTLSKTGSGIVGSVSFFKTTPDYGGGEKVVFYGRATTIPSTNPTGGGLFFVKSDDKPYWRDSAGIETSMLGGSGWPLTGTGLFTGAVIIDESVTSSNTLKFKTPALGVTSVNGKGIWIYNDSPAILNNQQISGSLVLEGQGFATTPVTTQPVQWIIYGLPIQGAANPNTSLVFASSVNGAAPTTRVVIQDGSGGIQTNSFKVLTTNAVLSIRSQTTSTTGAAIQIHNNGVNFNATSGTQSHFVIGITSESFAPSSGSAAWNSLLIQQTVNQAGGANGQIIGVNNNPTITAAVNVTGYDWNPITPANITGIHFAFHSTSGLLSFTQNVYTSGSPTHFTLVGAAHTNLATTVEASSINLDYSQTIQFATGTLALQRFARLQIGTVGFVGASTLTRAVGLSISGPVKSGANTTITNSIGLEVVSRDVSGGTGVTNAYAAMFNTPTAANGTNWALGLVGNVALSGQLFVGASLTTVPHSYIQSDGSFATGIINNSTSGTTINAANFTVLVNASSGNYTLNIPTAVGCIGRIYIVKKVDATANTVTITPAGVNIDGAATKVINTQYAGYAIQSDGANWFIIGAF